MHHEHPSLVDDAAARCRGSGIPPDGIAPVSMWFARYSPSVPHIYTGGLMLAGVDEAQGDQAPRMPIMRWTTNIDGSSDPSSSSHIRCAMLRSVMKLSVICVSVPGIGCGMSVI